MMEDRKKYMIVIFNLNIYIYISTHAFTTYLK